MDMLRRLRLLHMGVGTVVIRKWAVMRPLCLTNVAPRPGNSLSGHRSKQCTTPLSINKDPIIPHRHSSSKFIITHIRLTCTIMRRQPRIREAGILRTATATTRALSRAS